MKIERLTNQKKAILDYLESSPEHPDAYEIYESIKKGLPQVSLATVYRNLDAMVKKGQIRAIRIKDDRYNYDGMKERHHHFHCTKCGKVFNIEDKIILNFEELNKEEIVGLVEDYRISLTGVCKDCKNN